MNGIEMIEFVMRAIPREIMCGEGDGCILALLQLRSAVTDYPLLELRVTKRLICNFAVWIKCTFKFQSSLLSVVAASIRTQPDYFSANLGVQGLLDVLRSCFMDQPEGQKSLSTPTSNKCTTKNKTIPSMEKNKLNLANLMNLELNPPLSLKIDPENDFLIHGDDSSKLRENGIGLKSISKRHSFFNLFQAELLDEDINGENSDVKGAVDGRHIEINDYIPDEYNPDALKTVDLGDSNNDDVDTTIGSIDIVDEDCIENIGNINLNNDEGTEINDIDNDNVKCIVEGVCEMEGGDTSNLLFKDSKDDLNDNSAFNPVDLIVQSDSIPGDSVTGYSALSDSMPGDSIICDSISGDSIPGDSMPGDLIPGDQISDDQVSDHDMIPNGIMNKDAKVISEGNSNGTRQNRKILVDTTITANVNVDNEVMHDTNSSIENNDKENSYVSPMILNRQQKTHLRGIRIPTVLLMISFMINIIILLISFVILFLLCS
jgi:hypothetical protein